MGKSWYQSKTMWTNLTALIGAAATYFTTQNPAPLAAAGSAAVMSLVNIVLRLVTKQPIE